ncbi:hypothetical protein [Crossiella cryophila]|uniref:Uncharacterized protein n=1 Tax=Crossiella cryophila TaxID=43355 RepID=A0A7W7C8Y5_9PSEU|nr:hypothetical protein [Crossiella cryophila]MBB4676754.1 hypothetical protein [Crossiella cryophila]
MNKLVGKFAPVLALAAAVSVLGGATASAAPAGLPYLGPDGYKSLKLGMSEADALATGLLTEQEQIGSCVSYRFVSSEGSMPAYSGVLFDENRKLNSIGATSRMLTREGAWPNMHIKDVKVVYPQLTQDPDQPYLHKTPVPGNTNAKYHFVLDEHDVAYTFGLHSNRDAACGA